MIINSYKGTLGRIKTSLEKKYPNTFEKHILPGSIYIYDKFKLLPSRKKAKQYLLEDSFPIFKTIEIETINRCNGTCSFCPVNRNIDPRPFKLMDESLFVSIINQLKEINYSGYVGLYSNNEPLLDKRIFNFLKIAKEALPNANLYIFTNGTLLTIDKLNKLMQYLDTLIIDNYDDNLRLIKQVKEVYKYALRQDYKDNIKIYLRKQNEILLNRSGQAENRTKNNLHLKSCCFYPFEQMVIRSDGKASLCCNDATGKVTMGDTTKDSLLNIWNNENYFNVRNNLLYNRNKNPLCKNCDIVLTQVIDNEPFKIYKLLSALKKNKK